LFLFPLRPWLADAEITFTSVGACSELEDYLLKRLGKKSPHTKAKVLRILKHLIEKGHHGFRQDLQRRTDAIRNATSAFARRILPTCPAVLLCGRYRPLPSALWQSLLLFCPFASCSSAGSLDAVFILAFFHHLSPTVQASAALRILCMATPTMPSCGRTPRS